MPRLAALGGLVLLDGSLPVGGQAGRGRNLALLAILTRSGTAGVTRDRLAALLWPESDEDRARHSLDQAFYILRGPLGPSAFQSSGATVSIAPAVLPSDVADFEIAVEGGRLEDAVSLYSGPFLDGFHLSGSFEFERWVDDERAGLHLRFTSALESLARSCAARGDHGGAAESWRRLALVEPLSARIVLSLIDALVRTGDRTAALRVALAHEARVRTEFDAPADPAVLARIDELRSRPAGTTDHRPESRAAHRDRMSSVAEPAVDVSLSMTDQNGNAVPPANPGLATGSLRRAAIRLGLAAAVIALAILPSFMARGDTDAQALPTVAVVPFANETGRENLDAVGRMAADWISGSLSRTGLVVVVGARQTLMADAVVEGRVYASADSIRLEARVVGANAGPILLAIEPVTAPASHPAAALEPLRERVLGALGTLYDDRLRAWRGTALRPPPFAAYREFAAGLDLVDAPRDFDGATARFRHALEIDPAYALAGLWLAWTAVMAGDYERADSMVTTLRSQRETMAPLERAWHDRITALLEGDNEASYRAAHRMVTAAPQESGWIIALANTALDTNRPREAVNALLAAGLENLGNEQDYGWFLLTSAYHALGDYEAELQATRRADEEVGPGWGFTGPGVAALAALGRTSELRVRLDELQHVRGVEGLVPAADASLLTAVMETRRHLGQAVADSIAAYAMSTGSVAARPVADSPVARARIDMLYELGRWADALRLLRDVPARPGDRWYLGMSGLLAARQGDTAAANRFASELAGPGAPFLFGEPELWRARILTVLGQHGTAVDLLRQAFANGQGALTWYFLHVGRDFDPLRSEPGFEALVRPRF